MKRGEHIIHQHTVEPSITATAWGDRNVVFLVSSVSSPTKSITVQRHVEGYERVAVPAPQVVGDYQHSMRGVDWLDQQINSKRPGAKTLRWWVAIAWGIINLIVHNAYVLHRECCIAADERPLSNYAFRLRLADQLIGSYRGRARIGRPPAAPGGGEHRIVRAEKRVDCSQCSSQAPGGQRVRSLLHCALWCACLRHLLRRAQSIALNSLLFRRRAASLRSLCRTPHSLNCALCFAAVGDWSKGQIWPSGRQRVNRPPSKYMLLDFVGDDMLHRRPVDPSVNGLELLSTFFAQQAKNPCRNRENGDSNQKEAIVAGKLDIALQISKHIELMVDINTRYGWPAYWFDLQTEVDRERHSTERQLEPVLNRYSTRSRSGSAYRRS